MRLPVDRERGGVQPPASSSHGEGSRGRRRRPGLCDMVDDHTEGRSVLGCIGRCRGGVVHRRLSDRAGAECPIDCRRRFGDAVVRRKACRHHGQAGRSSRGLAHRGTRTEKRGTATAAATPGAARSSLDVARGTNSMGSP